MEPSENFGPLQKETPNLTVELEAEIRNSHQHAGDVEDSSKKHLYLETEKKSLQNNNGSKNLVSITEDTGTIGASTMICTSAVQQEKCGVLSRQTEKSFLKECPSESNNLPEEGNSRHRIFVSGSAMQQHGESLVNESYNFLMQKENDRNEHSKQSGSIHEEKSFIKQEDQTRTELFQVLEKQIENLRLALVESQFENVSLTNKHQRWIEEHDGSTSNMRSNTSGAELARAQKENQKLRKQLAGKATELKNLYIMFSSSGKEKEIMTTELALKVRILADMEEQLNDLKEQNKTLANKLVCYAREHKSKTREMQGTISWLQKRDKLLADQLLKSSEGCRTLKRQVNELQEHNRVLKKEIGNLKSSVQKQEQSTHILESERRAFQNELVWGRQQLHILQEKCKCFKEKTESVTKQDLTKPNRQKSFRGEVALLEQLLLKSKEKLTCFEAECDIKDKECKVLKEEIIQLQTELSYLRAENNSLKHGGPSDVCEKKLSADNLQSKNAVLENKIATTGNRIKNMGKECRQIRNREQEKAQEKVKGALFFNSSLDNLGHENQCIGFQLQNIQLQNMCREDEGAKSRISSTNEAILLHHDRNTNLEEQVSSRDNSIKELKDASDMPFCKKENHQADRNPTTQDSNKSSVVSSMEQEKKVVDSQISSLANQMEKLHQVINGLQISTPYSLEAIIAGDQNVEGLKGTVKEQGEMSANMQNERAVLEACDQELYKQLVVSEQLLKEIEEQISRLAYERNGCSIKAASITQLEK